MDKLPLPSKCPYKHSCEKYGKPVPLIILGWCNCWWKLLLLAFEMCFYLGNDSFRASGCQLSWMIEFPVNQLVDQHLLQVGGQWALGVSTREGLCKVAWKLWGFRRQAFSGCTRRPHWRCWWGDWCGKCPGPDRSFARDGLWSQLLHLKDEGLLPGAWSPSGFDVHASSIGIVLGHACSLLQVCVLEITLKALSKVWLSKLEWSCVTTPTSPGL